MSEQRQDAGSGPQPLVPKLIRWPADWVARIDEARGEQSFSDYVRLAVFQAIDNGCLSDSPQWGQGRPAAPVQVDDVLAEIRRAAEHEMSRHTKKHKRSA